MKKYVTTLAIILLLGACAKPKNDDDYKNEKKKSDCGCQSSENILDLRGTSENPNDSVTNPTAKL